MKVSNDMSVIKNLGYSLLRKSLVTIYKAFLRPLINYGDTKLKMNLLEIVQ